MKERKRKVKKKKQVTKSLLRAWVTKIHFAYSFSYNIM